MAVSLEVGEVELEKGLGDSEEKNGGRGEGVQHRVEWNGEDTGRLKGGRTRMRKRRKGQSRDPVRFFPPESTFSKLEH